MTTRDGHYFCGNCPQAGRDSAGNFLAEKLAILEHWTTMSNVTEVRAKGDIDRTPTSSQHRLPAPA